MTKIKETPHGEQGKETKPEMFPVVTQCITNTACSQTKIICLVKTERDPYEAAGIE